MVQPTSGRTRVGVLERRRIYQKWGNYLYSLQFYGTLLLKNFSRDIIQLTGPAPAILQDFLLRKGRNKGGIMTNLSLTMQEQGR